MKVCYVASSGGHWEELMCLGQIIDKYDSVLITEKGGQAEDIQMSNLYTVQQMNRREPFFIAKFVPLFIQAFRILCKERPDVILTTGALISFPYCIVGKILGKKIIYIESFARVEGKSLTGKLVYPIADLFVVQWNEMLKFYPKAKYGGGIF